MFISDSEYDDILKRLDALEKEVTSLSIRIYHKSLDDMEFEEDEEK